MSSPGGNRRGSNTASRKHPTGGKDWPNHSRRNSTGTGRLAGATTYGRVRSRSPVLRKTPLATTAQGQRQLQASAGAGGGQGGGAAQLPSLNLTGSPHGTRTRRSRSVDMSEGNGINAAIIGSPGHDSRPASRGLSPAQVRRSAAEILSQYPRTSPPPRGKRTRAKRASLGSPAELGGRSPLLSPPPDMLAHQVGPDRDLHPLDFHALIGADLSMDVSESESKETVMANWLTTYSRVRPVFTSLAVECEVLLEQARHAEFTAGYRAELVTAAAFDVFDKVIGQMGSYGNVMRSVRNIFASSVYAGTLCLAPWAHPMLMFIERRQTMCHHRCRQNLRPSVETTVPNPPATC